MRRPGRTGGGGVRLRVWVCLVATALLAGCTATAERAPVSRSNPAAMRSMLLDVEDLAGFDVDSYRPRRQHPDEAGLPFCLQVRRQDQPEQMVMASFVDADQGGVNVRLLESVARYRPGAAEAYLEAVRRAVVSCETAGAPAADVPGVRYELRPEPALGDDALSIEHIHNGGLFAIDQATTLVRIDQTIVTLYSFTADGSDAELPYDLIERAVDRAA